MFASKQEKSYSTMKQSKYKEQYSFFEKYLLNLRSGIYLSIYDIVFIAQKLGFDLPYKTRELTLQKLFILVKEDKKESQLISILLKLLEEQKQEYQFLYSSYPTPLLQTILQQLQTTKMLILKELHVKEDYET